MSGEGVTEGGGYFGAELWKVGQDRRALMGCEVHAFSARHFQKGLEDREQNWEGLGV